MFFRKRPSGPEKPLPIDDASFRRLTRADLFRRWERVDRQPRAQGDRFTAGDVLAMILAVFSLLLPWLLLFGAVMAGLVALLYFFVLK